MASHPEDAVFDYGRISAPISHAARESSRAQGPRGRANSTDITHCGGCFVEGHDEAASEYPAQLDISEEEDIEKPPNSPSQHGLPPHYSSLGYGEVPSFVSPEISTSNSRTPTLIRAHLEPYLQPGDFRRLGLRSADGRSRSRRRRGPVHRRPTSPTASTASAIAYAPSISTTTTVSVTRNYNNNNDSSSRYTPYFSPGHTPSNHSMATEEDEMKEGRAPTSPLPYSSYHPYDPLYGRNAIEQINERHYGTMRQI